MNSKSLGKIAMFFLSITTLTLTIFLISGPCINLAYGGVDNLRGRWDLVAEGLGTSGYNFTIFVNDLSIDPNNSNNLLAAGCFQSNQSGFLSPMSFKAEQTDNGYDISFLGTAILSEDQPPFIIQFFGPVIINGNGVKDDVAGGDASKIRTEGFEGGSWIGVHHDRRRKKCPPVQIPPLNFSADVRAHIDQNNQNIVFTGFDCGTDIVSSGVLVEMPDGTSTVLKPYTDIFSPDVDFVSSFRFTDGIDGVYPIVGEPYTFTLLDAVGNPIPGSTTTDVWAGVCVDAAINLTAQITNNKDIDMSWSPPVLGEDVGFLPGQGLGFYQVEIFPADGGNTVYGANWVGLPGHVIPWDSFVAPGIGYPDGNDLGVALNELDKGTYMIRIVNHSFPPPDSQGQGFECIVASSENILFQKDSDSILLLNSP